MEAATELLVESGARAVTVDGVEAASGVAKSTLYRHFSSRDELLVEVVRSNLPMLEAPDLSNGFEAALRDLTRSAAEVFAGPQWSRIFPTIVALRTSMPELHDLIEVDKAQQHAALAIVLELGVSEGVLPATIDLDDASHLLGGPLVLAAITGPPDADDHDRLLHLADVVVDRFIAGHRP